MQDTAYLYQNVIDEAQIEGSEFFLIRFFPNSLRLDLVSSNGFKEKCFRNATLETQVLPLGLTTHPKS